MVVGGRIGFFTGDPLRLLEDAQLLKPNFFPSVPRVLNRIYQAAMIAGDVPGLKGNIFRKAMATKIQRFRTTGEVIHPLWDRIVFRKVRYLLNLFLLLAVLRSDPKSSWWRNQISSKRFGTHHPRRLGLSQNRIYMSSQ